MGSGSDDTIAAIPLTSVFDGEMTPPDIQNSIKYPPTLKFSDPNSKVGSSLMCCF
jgi:hypothetical protein